MMSKPLHTWLGWAGTTIALIEYGLYATGVITSVWFFGIGILASGLLVWALLKDKAYYGVFLQSIFIIFNIIGMVRLM
jgi:hypothetical protein